MNNQKWSLLGGAGLGVGLGAGLMYLLDPKDGVRRRARARDKAMHALKLGRKAALRTSKDLGKRTRGLVEEAGSKLRRELRNDPKLRRFLRSNGREKVGAALGAVALSLLGRSLASRLQ